MEVKFLVLSNSDFFSFLEYSIKKYYEYREDINYLSFININWIRNSRIVFDKKEQSFLVLMKKMKPKFLFYFKSNKNIVGFFFLKEIKEKDEENKISNLILSNEMKISREYFRTEN